MDLSEAVRARSMYQSNCTWHWSRTYSLEADVGKPHGSEGRALLPAHDGAVAHEALEGLVGVGRRQGRRHQHEGGGDAQVESHWGCDGGGGGRLATVDGLLLLILTCNAASVGLVPICIRPRLAHGEEYFKNWAGWRQLPWAQSKWGACFNLYVTHSRRRRGRAGGGSGGAFACTLNLFILKNQAT